LIQLFTVPKCGQIKIVLKDQLDADPRGIVWMYEPPTRNANYTMGVDATKGIPNWDRKLRTQDDDKVDNGAIEIIRVGDGFKIPDSQVCEYAGPDDPEDLADIANALGRLYAGRSDDDQCLANIEVWPGPGWMTAKKMIHQYGYTNIWIPRYVNTLQPQSARNVIGWQSNQRTMRDLWIRGTKHIASGLLKVHSPSLVEEFTDCETDPVKMTAKATFGHHDDRAIAILLAIYAAHDWNSSMVETQKTEAVVGTLPNWQASDISAEDLAGAWEERFSELLED
jgi:hypothetical protein